MSVIDRRAVRLLIAGAVWVAVGTACGSSSSSEPASSSTSSPGSTASSTSTADGTGQGKVDVCAIVTAADAATVFGETAEPQDSPSSEPLVSGLCIYSHPGDDLAVRNLLQARVYPGEQFYGDRLFPDATTLNGFGEKGFINVDTKRHKVDLQFVKDGKTGVIAYSTGAGIDIAAREDAVKAVGKKLAAAL